MADAPAPPATGEPSSQPSEHNNPTSQTSQTDSASASVAPSLPQKQSATPIAPTPNPNPSPGLVPPPPPAVASYAPPPISGATVSFPPSVPSFRPVPQFSPIPNYQNPGVPPPGVSSAPSMVQGSVPAPMMTYQVPPGQAMNPAMRPYAPMPNGYVATPQGTMTPAGLVRYPSPYPAMVRPAFPLRPPGAVGMLPGVARPHVPGIPGVRPIIPPIVRPVVPSVTPAEKPQTTVYVGKIAPTVDNDFMLSLLRLCGPVKSWKRAPDPTDGIPRGFGFCEFESADGVLRALRLLNKFNIDGQELVLNVNQGTREYLKRYVEKKTENAKKLKEGQAAEDGKEGDSASGVEKNEVLKSSTEDLKEENDAESKGNNNDSNFGIATDEDREGDHDALEKLTNMIEERLKTKPLPPPPAQVPVDSSGHANPELLSKLREGDSDIYITKNDTANDRNDDETTSDNKATSEHDKPETSSPERSRRYDRRSRERDIKRDKEREIERYERDVERERVRKEREQRRKIDEAEREYVERLKDWEYREREKEKQRQIEKEKEKDRERKRKKEILYDEEDEEDDSRKRWRRSVLEDKRRRRQREKEDDLVDRLKEEDEIAESKKSAEEEQQQQLQRDALKLLSGRLINENEKKIIIEETSSGGGNKAIEQDYQDGDNVHHPGDRALQNGAGYESATVANGESEMRQSGNVPARKLGFGLAGSGKRTAVPSVFHEEDDDDVHKDKKMKPLVPIDYSTDELQAVQPSVSGAHPVNLAAAAEFAKHISHVASKDEKSDAEKERSKRSHDRSGRRDRDRNDDDNSRTRDENKDKTYDREVKTTDTKKLLDAKQLIDMIPKTKEELFSYEINWTVYDKHELHERMRPWISKKITEFLGEEETTLVDYIVSSTQEHVKASQMLELLQSILDEEAEMFVLKMWRMLIFEIKKMEAGLSAKSKC